MMLLQMLSRRALLMGAPPASVPTHVALWPGLIFLNSTLIGDMHRPYR